MPKSSLTIRRRDAFLSPDRIPTAPIHPGYDGYDPSTPVWTDWKDAVADEEKTN